MGSGTITTLEWQETTWEGRPASDLTCPKTTIASDAVTMTGEVEGAAVDRWIMSYAADGTARFVGMTYVTGAVSGREGAFALQHVGRFDADGLHTTFTVVPDSGTAGLAGITGDGTFTHTGEDGALTHYTFEPQLP